MRKPDRSGLFSTAIPVLVGALLAFLPLTSAFAWSDTVHESMTEAATNVLSKMLNDKFDKGFLAKLPRNVLEPDEKRVIEHTDVYQCGSMINTLATKAQRLIHKNDDWSKVMFLMAEAAHYIEDLNNPYHCGGAEDYHEEFETVALSGNWTDEAYDGFHYIKDYRVFADNTCNFSQRYQKFSYKLLQTYDPDYYKKFITPIWRHAVNDVLDLWLTIFWNGLGKDYQTFGLPEPKGIRDDREIKFEKIKDLK